MPVSPVRRSGGSGIGPTRGGGPDDCWLMASPRLLSAIVLAALIALAACGPVSSSREDAPHLTPQQVLLRAAEASGAQDSYQVEINDTQKFTQDDAVLVTRTDSTGIYQPPDRLRVATEVTYQAAHDDRITFRTEQISIGLTNYRRDPDTEEWRVDAHPNVTPLDELELTPESLQALEFGPDRILEGEGVFHLRASHLDEESGLHSRVGIWIGRSDFLFKRAIYGFESPEGLEHDRTLHFSDYGASIEIGPPVTQKVLAPITANDLQEDAIDPRDISWENVTLDKPGRALVTGIRSEDGSCGTSIHLSGGAGESQTSGGRWGRTIWTDSNRCVHLIEYGHSSEEDRDRFSREQPGGSVATAVPQPAEQPQR